MKKYVTIIFLLFSGSIKAQKIEAIFVNLYTDSLKKGTYNYINIDGQLPDGRFIPLDSTHLLFTASAGKFSGNSLCLDRDINEKKIIIKAVLKQIALMRLPVSGLMPLEIPLYMDLFFDKNPMRRAGRLRPLRLKARPKGSPPLERSPSGRRQ